MITVSQDNRHSFSLTNTPVSKCLHISVPTMINNYSLSREPTMHSVNQHLSKQMFGYFCADNDQFLVSVTSTDVSYR